MEYMEELHKRLGMKDGGEFPDLNKDGKTSYADVLIGRGVRLKKQEGGSMDDQMKDMMGEQPDMDMVFEYDNPISGEKESSPIPMGIGFFYPTE